MNFKADRQYMLECFRKLVEIPSPVSYYDEINPYMEKLAEEYGLSCSFDRKHTAYYTLEGEDNSKTVLIGAHLDTLGLMIRNIKPDGTISIRPLGGVNFMGLEGSSVVVHTRDGRKYSGILACTSHSTHVFDDARTLVRDENNIYVSLDENVTTADEVRALGIESGDIVSINPEFEYTENGYIKSRFIDNKAGVAAVLGALKYLKDNNIKPKYRTLLAFPHYEEINHGGAYVPPEVEEYVAIDIGLIGPENRGSERKVSICCKDNFSPYDRGLTTKIINCAKSCGCDYAVDVFYHYGTDANAAIRSGNNVYSAAFGMGCFCSHGRERTHISSIENTAELILAYMLAE